MSFGYIFACVRATDSSIDLVLLPGAMQTFNLNHDGRTSPDEEYYSGEL
jgi:hypothetical protein